jgi:DNA-binding NarL/FixJ family response regulator
MAKTILIADDDERVRKALCQLFEREHDYELSEQAKDGQEAVEFATRCRPDLVILDLEMPVKNGIEAAKGIKKILPDVPIILFTMHEEIMFNYLPIATYVDRVVMKSDIVHLLADVRDLAPIATT